MSAFLGRSPSLLALAGAYSCQVVSCGPSKPHILLILADDLGWNDVGFNVNAKTAINREGWATSDEISGIPNTPTIDQLAAEGTILDSFYVQPLCSPTRATIMTGRTPQHTGVGPNVVGPSGSAPYGVPAREVFLPELLRDLAGYRTHMVGKWHLGDCHEGYLPTARGFQSFLGYLGGHQGYFDSALDRNGTEGSLPTCLGDKAENIYSTTLFSQQVDGIVSHHGIETPDEPLFIYLALQHVHAPYDVPDPALVDVDALFPHVADKDRQTYMGMLKAMDLTVSSAVASFQAAGLWDDTVLFFLSDNGGVDVGSNFPLRGTKTHLWEGGIRAVAFVRGTNSALAPAAAGKNSGALISSVDLLPSLVFGLAGVSEGAVANYRNRAGYAPLPSDGLDQWVTFASAAAQGPRTFVHHNVVPVGSSPVEVDGAWSSNECIQAVDDRTGLCKPDHITGGAIRVGDWKLLVTHGSGKPPWSDSVPHSRMTPPRNFTPGSEWSFPNPKLYDGQYYLFNIVQDPYESQNLAASEPAIFTSMMTKLTQVAEDADAVGDMAWKWGISDTHVDHNPGGCWGPAEDSKYCSYGREFSCMIAKEGLEGNDLVQPAADSADECMQACADNPACHFWDFDAPACSLKTARGIKRSCDSCMWGPRSCPNGITPSPPAPVPPPAPPAPSPSPPAPGPSKAKCCWKAWGDESKCGNFPGGDSSNGSSGKCNTDWSKSCSTDADCSRDAVTFV